MASRKLVTQLFRAGSRLALTHAHAPERTSLLAHRPAAAAFSTTHYPRQQDSGASASAAPSPSALPQPPSYLDDAERRIFNTLVSSFQPSKLEVQDISGGCGSMYALDIVSEKFAGLPLIKQHRLVNQALGDEIKKWHGVQLKTKAP